MTRIEIANVQAETVYTSVNDDGLDDEVKKEAPSGGDDDERSVDTAIIISSYDDQEDPEDVLYSSSSGDQEYSDPLSPTKGRKGARASFRPRNSANNNGEEKQPVHSKTRTSSPSASPQRRKTRRVSSGTPSSLSPKPMKRGRKKSRSQSPGKYYNFRSGSFTPEPTTVRAQNASRSTSPRRKSMANEMRKNTRSASPQRGNLRRVSSESSTPASLSPKPIKRGRRMIRSKSPTSNMERPSSLTPPNKPRKGRRKSRSVDPAPGAATKKKRYSGSPSPRRPKSDQLPRRNFSVSRSPSRPASEQQRVRRGGKRASLSPVPVLRASSDQTTKRKALSPVPLSRATSDQTSSSPKRSSLSPVPLRPSSDQGRRGSRLCSISPVSKRPASEQLPAGRRSTRLRERIGDGASDEFLLRRKSARMRNVFDDKTNGDASEEMKKTLPRRSERLQSILSEENLAKPPKKERLSRILRVDFTGEVQDADIHTHNQPNNNNNNMLSNMFPFWNSLFKAPTENDDDTPPISSFSMDEKDHRRTPSSEIVFDTSLLGSGLDEHIISSRGTQKHDPHGKTEESGPTGEARFGLMVQKTKNKSTRSLISIDLEFQGESKFIQLLRYLRILAPYCNERPIEKRVRMFTWAALFCDFLAALVSITTFKGVSMCCGKPILSIMGNANWNKIIEVITYLYMIMILVEVIPVVRDGMPFNVMNPVLGFIITFAVFFDDNVAEAVTMWIIEIIAIICEFMTYRLKNKIYQEKEKRIKETDEEFQEFKEVKRARKQAKKDAKKDKLKRADLAPTRSSSLSPVRQRTSSTLGMESLTTEGTELSSTRKSTIGRFDGAITPRKSSLSPMRHGSTAVVPKWESKNEDDASQDSAAGQVEDLEVGKFSASREIRLMRKLRIWRQDQELQVKHLRYLFAGVAINIGLVVFTLLLIIMISKNSGLCVVDLTTPAIFASGQLEKCFDCVGVTGTCEICRDDGTSHCYYPYY